MNLTTSNLTNAIREAYHNDKYHHDKISVIIGRTCYLDSWLRDNFSAHFGGFGGFGGMILAVLVDLGRLFWQFHRIWEENSVT